MLLKLLFIQALAMAAKPDHRVVALSPALTEIVYALGGEKDLVGVSEYTDYPKEAKSLPSVGPYSKPILEKILSLRPTLVLLPEEGPEDIKFQLQRAQLNYKSFSIKKISDVGTVGKQISDLMDLSKEGSKFQKDWEEQISKVLSNSKRNNVRTFVEIQKDPLIVAGGATFLNEMVESCGGRNIFEDYQGYPRINLELVFTRLPELILIAGSSKQEGRQSLRRWGKVLNKLSPRIVLMDPDILTRPGPRLIEGLKKVCRIVADSK